MVPLLGSVTGVTFDVGYFYGVGINYFTLFSLSEHLVFALEALPLALALAALIVASIAVYDGVRIQTWVNDLNARILGSTKADEIKLKPIVMRNLVRKDVLYWIFDAAAVGFWIYMRAWAIATLTSFVLIAFFVSDLWFQVVLSRRVLMAYGCVMVLCTSFVAGYDWGSNAIETKRAQDTIEVTGSFIRGKILRSGDRGILAYSPDSSEIKLVPWSEI